MKSLILSFLFILCLTATNTGKPINDIFSVKEPVFNEEDYVNDIPFNTYEIAIGAILEGDQVKLEEEAEVDDIPFDTRAIAGKYLLLRNMKSSNEININDIPFNTEKVFYEKLAARLTENFRNENNINDIPCDLEYIICSYKYCEPSHGMVKHKKILPGFSL
jgi:hypothetical protein